MDEILKKKRKEELKLLKKREKQKLKDLKKGKSTNVESISGKAEHKSSKLLLFAELIKGLLYLILSVSLIFSIILGEKGVIITLNDIIDNLFFATTGKIVLIIIAIGLFIYGLKQLKLIK